MDAMELPRGFGDILAETLSRRNPLANEQSLGREREKADERSPPIRRCSSCT